MLPGRPESNTRRRRLSLAAAFFLFAGGAALLAWAGWSVVRLEWQQRHDLRELEELQQVAARLRPADASRLSPVSARPPLPGALLGKVTIPARGVSASIREGVTDDVLDVAAGHLPGTPLPGEAGNSAIAAHRDSLFAGLRSAAEGDLVLVDTPAGRTTYRISRLSIVEPRDLSVLDPTDEATLTLITCYPFDYVGPAPKRFVAQAERLAGPPRADS